MYFNISIKLQIFFQCAALVSHHEINERRIYYITESSKFVFTIIKIFHVIEHLSSKNNELQQFVI